MASSCRLSVSAGDQVQGRCSERSGSLDTIVDLRVVLGAHSAGRSQRRPQSTHGSLQKLLREAQESLRFAAGPPVAAAMVGRSTSAAADSRWGVSARRRGPNVSRTYLDHAATTPMVPAAIEAMQRELTRPGNASSLHGSGRSARRVVEESREAIASCVGAQPAEVIFTSGGTESDNLALKGSFWSARDASPGRTRIVVSTIEHHAVLDAADWLVSGQGAVLSLLAVDGEGLINPNDLDRLVGGDDVATVSVMWANNEVGAAQPIAQVANWASSVGARSHSDAVQAVGRLPLSFAESGLDLLTFTAHKLGGPYGVGALLAKREVALTPVSHGGGQERDIRSGTFNVAAVAGFAAAVQHTTASLAAESARIAALRRRLLAGIASAVPDVVRNGPRDEADSLPGVLNVSFPGCDADAMLMLLDAAGIDCSTGSACTAGVSQGSHVLLAMGRSAAVVRSSLRFSLGHSSTGADVDALLAALPEAVRRARLAGSLAGGAAAR